MGIDRGFFFWDETVRSGEVGIGLQGGRAIGRLMGSA
jgi:hypothetical protein